MHKNASVGSRNDWPMHVGGIKPRNLRPETGSLMQPTCITDHMPSLTGKCVHRSLEAP